MTHGTPKDWNEALRQGQSAFEAANKAWTEPPREAEDTWPDPDWSLLEDRRGELPAFPCDALPSAWQHWLVKAAHGAGVTPDHVAVPLLAVTSGLIGGARRVRASRSWSEPMAIWTAAVGFSGSGKTPGLDVSRRALAHIERGRRDSVQELRRAHEQRTASAKAALKKWKSEVQKAVDQGHAPPAKPTDIDEPTPFVAPRFCVSDATTERLAILMEARPRGLLAVIDELSALFANMSRYSGGDDRGFWLQAWGGGHHVVERVNRPPVVIDNLLVGLTGGFQPDKLETAFRGADDGMYARVLFGWPVEPDYYELTDNISEIEPEFLEALMRLIDLKEDDHPRCVPLSADARAEFENFRHFRHQQKRLLDGRDREVWAKSESHVLRLAGTLCFMSWAMYSPPDLMPDRDDRFQQMLKQAAEPVEIGREFIVSAMRLWKEYFWPHARAALRQIGLTDRHRYARKALRWVRAHDRTEVSLQDVRRHALNHQLDAEQAEKVIATLVKTGWLRLKSETTGGRPRHRWLVNPALFS